MVTVDETLRAASEQNVVDDFKRKLAAAAPTVGMFQHIAATQAAQMGFTVTLLDGATYITSSADFMFTDGMSIIMDQHRIYIPKTAIKSILIHNPGEKFED